MLSLRSSALNLKEVLDALSCATTTIHVPSPSSMQRLSPARLPLVQPEQHEYFELAVCFVGEMNFYGKSGVIRLRKGDAVIVKPDVWHYESFSRKSQPYRMCWVVSTPRLINCLFTHYRAGSFVVSSYGASPMVDETAVMENISREVSGHSLHGRIKANALLLGLLVDLDRRLHGNAVVSPHSEIDPVRQLLRIVHARFREPLQIRHIAKEVGLSAGYLSRRFHETTGVIFKKYLNEIRIRHAQRLLESGWNVKLTAEECGFQDVYYFGRVFKERCNISPGRFARRNTVE